MSYIYIHIALTVLSKIFSLDVQHCAFLESNPEMKFTCTNHCGTNTAILYHIYCTSANLSWAVFSLSSQTIRITSGILNAQLTAACNAYHKTIRGTMEPLLVVTRQAALDLQVDRLQRRQEAGCHVKHLFSCKASMPCTASISRFRSVFKMHRFESFRVKNGWNLNRRLYLGWHWTW